MHRLHCAFSRTINENSEASVLSILNLHLILALGQEMLNSPSSKEGLGLKETCMDRIHNGNIFNLRVPEMDLIALVFVLDSDLKSSLSVDV